MHLHPAWQQVVLPGLTGVFPRIQFVVTTHSPQVLTSVPSECIRVLGDGQVFAAPAGTEGAEASRVLKRVFGVDVRPPESPATQELLEYLNLVDQDQGEAPRAIELRRVLDERYRGEEPALVRADLQIENRKWELGQ
jgi:predicted ATP-binding protein involved in virulence